MSEHPAPPPADTPGLKARAVFALRWSALAQVLRQVVQLALSVVLARLLTPADFGLLGMVVVFSGFAGLFSDLGLGAALIQSERADARHLSSAFWLTAAASLALAGCLAAAAPLVAGFYGEPRLTGLTRLVAANLLLAGLGAVPNALLARELRFRALALIELASILTGGAVACVLAVRGLGPASLAWQALIGSAVMLLLLFPATGWRPTLSVSWRSVRELSGFGLPLTGFNVVNYWVRNGDNLLVGRFLGPAPLGIYARAYGLMLVPLQQVTHTVGRVMFPVLARLQAAKDEFRSVYLRAVTVVAFVTMPMMAVLFVTADHFVPAIYGPHWREVVPVLRILCLLGMVQSVGATTGWIFQGMGRTDWQLAWGVSAGTLCLGAIGVGVWLGSVTAVALCYAVASGVLLVYPAFAIPGRLIGLTFRELTTSLTGIAACTAAAALVAWLFGRALPADWGDLPNLLVQAAAGAATYLLAAAGLRLRALDDLRRLLVRRSTPAAAPAAAGGEPR